MNVDETEIYEFLKRGTHQFMSATEISRYVGARKRFIEDKNWARPILRRMEMDGLLESNEFGEYRLKNRPEDTTTFLKALEQPGVSLGDTTIISLDDIKEKDE